MVTTEKMALREPQVNRVYPANPFRARRVTPASRVNRELKGHEDQLELMV